MKKTSMDYIIVAIGALLFCLGLFLVKTIIDPQGVMRALPYVCIGLGCGAFGHGMGSIINRRALKKSPELQKQQEIEKNDERNLAIGNSAKAKSYDMMIFVFGALMLSYALMGIDMTALLLLVFAYLFVIAFGIYYRFKYDKEM